MLPVPLVRVLIKSPNNNSLLAYSLHCKSLEIAPAANGHAIEVPFIVRYCPLGKVLIILTPGADKVTAAVLSGDVNIGFCGSEQSIYVYNEGAKDYLVNFAGLTKRDGSFIVGRKNEKFNIKDLKGTHIIAGREGGMPAMTLEYTLNQNGIELDELNFDTSIAFASMSGAFIGGTGDYVALFEPTALQLEKQARILFEAAKNGGAFTPPFFSFIRLDQAQDQGQNDSDGLLHKCTLLFFNQMLTHQNHKLISVAQSLVTYLC